MPCHGLASLACFVERDAEISLHLLFVFSVCAAHALQVSINLFLLVYLLHDLFAIVLHFINISLQLGNQGSHLLLVSSLLRDLGSKNCLTLI